MASVGKRGVISEMNVVPLIDVVLVLLIIFMVITPLLIGEMDVLVPDKAEVETIEQLPQDQIVLSVQQDRSMYINRDRVSFEELPERLERIFNAKSKDDRIIFFDAADNINYGEAVEVLDIVRGAGAQKIGIVEEHKVMTPELLQAEPVATP